ncbi:Na/Pi cotransporter family protein [Duncaniella freteri]|jgi:phosphate:Na+ symporter|uniref:Na/Pi cotransporter family protein n=14 Tax=Duncaniella TaxID=2518495 RepID=A0A4Z0V4Y8_9BACT|nr:Na/Pi cotransporter family protein [Duncaniella freteri]NBJ07974.1 Na/Pi cotransporter family protein [Alistipes sp. Z76]NCE69983.1 Na/Pi cotransporter family protein [Muribaculaceae bacterium M3]TGG39891.1 Na/Pi cotransporter family protein [Duncaniella freteri]
MSYSFLDLLCLLGSVALFLYGMKVMSEGLQKAAGDRLRNILSAMTRNRFTGMLTGILITALIQSSSASTVMVVSFVNAGLMSLGQSMAVIMGANVGTTFTAWIIALFGFKVNISAFVLPVIGLSIPLLFSKSSRNKSIGEFFIGFSFLFMGLDLISTYVPDLQSNPEMFAFLERYTSMGFGSVLIFTFVGLILTMVIQSSAATFAITLIMCSKGWIDFDLSCALVLGSNIGTTVTPLMASMGGNIAAKRTAMGHLLFNFLGTAWTLAIFFPFCHFAQWLTEELGQGDPGALSAFVNHIEATDPDTYNHLFDNTLPAGHPVSAQIAVMQQSVSIGLSVFHTVFNLINLSIMIWLTGLYVKIVEHLVPSRPNQEEEFQLKFIQIGMVSSSELNISQAEKEIVVYSQRVQRMIGMAQNIIHCKDNSEEFTKQFSRLEKYEEISDRMEIEIADYLNRCSEGRLSNEGKHRIAAMFRIVSEIESIADCCYGIGKILIRKRESNAQFSEEIYHNIDSMFIAVEAAMTNQILLLRDVEHAQQKDIITSYNYEREINNLRNQFRSANVENINEHHYEYQAGIYFMDVIGSLEKIGDYIINVVDEVKNLLRLSK